MKKRNTVIMYLISMFQGMVFYASISTLYRTARGLSLTQYALIDSITFIMTLVLEVPWGLLADRIGYRKTLLIANGFYAFSKFVFLKAYSFSGFLLERVFFSLAVSGISGVDQSLLYLSVDPKDSQKVFSRYTACGSGGILAAAGLFAMLRMDHDTAAIFTLAAYIIAFVLSFMLTEVRSSGGEQNEHVSLLQLASSTLKDHRIMLFILGQSLASVAVWTIAVFLNQGQYLACGGNERFIGIAFVLSGLLGLVSVFSDKLTVFLGKRKTVTLLLGVMATEALLLSLTGNLYLSFVLIASCDALYGLLTPLLSRIENDHIQVADRASQLSVYMMLGDLFSIIPNVMMGVSGERSLPVTFRWCAVMLAVSLVIFRLTAKEE
ncbi:MAG: MFS transporter [Erysipelotrichaceae bacterium]|nr:MFS transporter [Erysipelotrichaceae bacterium]